MDIVEEFGLAIAEETLREAYPSISDEVIKAIWEKCNGNPWNAVPLYKIANDFGMLL